VTKKRFLGIAVLLTAITLFAATQWSLWLTGRGDLAPLPLVSGGPKVEPTSRIWVDTDAACGANARTDPDDCLAILWLACLARRTLLAFPPALATLRARW
jgi:hypothetical protein